MSLFRWHGLSLGKVSGKLSWLPVPDSLLSRLLPAPLCELRSHKLGHFLTETKKPKSPLTLKISSALPAWEQSTEIFLTSKAGSLWKVSTQRHYLFGWLQLWEFLRPRHNTPSADALGKRREIKGAFKAGSRNFQAGFTDSSNSIQGDLKGAGAIFPASGREACRKNLNLIRRSTKVAWSRGEVRSSRCVL